MPKRRRRVIGFIPRLWRGVAAAGRWTFRHPQPFLVVSALSVIFWVAWGYAQRADAFHIARVILPPQSSLKIPGSLIGTNLWEVDLRTLSEELKKQQPWLKDVRVVRQLPDSLRIDPIARIPVAQVHLDRWYSVDRDGFILPQVGVDGSNGLVRLVGVDRGGTALRVGRENTNEQLALALRVLETLRRSPALILRRLTDINVADPHEIRLVLDGDTEVRCGSEEELGAHLARLRATLKIIAKQQLTVRYIDVRFQEPVIGPRT